jgi:hypothetical protein
MSASTTRAVSGIKDSGSGIWPARVDRNVSWGGMFGWSASASADMVMCDA